jgi:hypothetical protein
MAVEARRLKELFVAAPIFLSDRRHEHTSRKPTHTSKKAK